MIIVLVAILTAVRLIAAATIPLTEDEAYYRLWADHLAFGYFDHPPMVAWWIALGRVLAGDDALGVRLLPVFATTATTVLIIDTGRTLGFSQRTSERAGIWYNAMILIGLGGEIMTPDSPATLFWAACLWALAKGARSEKDPWWLLGGACAGLAMLSKYSALFIGPGVLLWLATSAEGRQALRRPWPWGALAVAVLVFSPNLIWNADHHWLSFSKQFSRVAPTGFTPRHILDFPASQFFLLNPLIAIFAIYALRDAAQGRGERAVLILPLVTIPFAAYLCLHSLHAGVQAHWPAPLYPALAILAAHGADRRSDGLWRRVATAAPLIGYAVSAIVLLHMAIPQTDWFGRRDPIANLRGWPTFARDVESLRRSAGAEWVGTLRYGTAAELLNQRKSNAPILELIERTRYADPAPQTSIMGIGLVIDLNRRLDPAEISPCFKTIQRLPSLQRGDSGSPSARYDVYRVQDPLVDLLRQGCWGGKDRLELSSPS